MDIRHRNTLRLVLAVVLGLGAVGLGALAVSVCFGLTAEYGVGGSGDVPLYAAFFALPVLAATLAAMAAVVVRGRAVVRRRVYPAAVVLLAVDPVILNPGRAVAQRKSSRAGEPQLQLR